jgi:hypothetical protein
LRASATNIPMATPLLVNLWSKKLELKKPIIKHLSTPINYCPRKLIKAMNSLKINNQLLIKIIPICGDWQLRCSLNQLVWSNNCLMVLAKFDKSLIKLVILVMELVLVQAIISNIMKE